MKCKDCGREMLTAAGCEFTHLVYEGDRTPVKRRPVSPDWCGPNGRCHDCGAKAGRTHHFGCDVERCPKCGGQIISCDCTPPTQLARLARGPRAQG